MELDEATAAVATISDRQLGAMVPQPMPADKDFGVSLKSDPVHGASPGCLSIRGFP
jgi:hypothetical protein